MRSRHPVLFAAVPALLALQVACAFDQTRVPALPDGVLQLGGESDTVGPVCDDTCSAATPDVAGFGAATGALTGTWARRVVQRTERDTRNNGNWLDASWTVYELVTVLQEGTTMRETTRVCDITMKLIDGAQTTFPSCMIVSLPVLVEEGTFLTWKNDGDVVEAAYANPTPLVRLFGLSPAAATKAWETCGEYFDESNVATVCPLALWPEIVDTDCDGNPGITLDIAVGTSAPAAVYMVQRDVMTRSGTVESTGRIAGKLSTFEENNANLGTADPMLLSNPPSRVVEGASTFVMVRLGDTAGCDDVAGAAFDE